MAYLRICSIAAECRHPSLDSRRTTKRLVGDSTQEPLSSTPAGSAELLTPARQSRLPERESPLLPKGLDRSGPPLPILRRGREKPGKRRVCFTVPTSVAVTLCK